MNKLVINTQYLENYGTKENPYMKFKGGNTYVMNNCGDLNENEIASGMLHKLNLISLQICFKVKWWL